MSARAAIPRRGAALLLAAAGAAQGQGVADALPRHLTPAESAWLRDHPLQPPEAVTAPPTGPLHCAAEYEPMDGILLSWKGQPAWVAILAQMAAAITTVGQARVFVVVDCAGQQSAVIAALAAAGADLSRVRFVVALTDSIWIRDYGPRYVFEGDCRVVVDHTYNRPRPFDDRLPAAFAREMHHTFYEHDLVHGGGNYHLDAVGRAYATRLIAAENPSRTEAGIAAVFAAYQGVDTWLFDAFPRTIDATQHLDMWMQVAGDRIVMVSDWPQDAGSVQDRICDGAAAFLAGRGYAVHRVPARHVGGVHYTYTNVVMCNDLLLVPQYANTSVAPHNQEAVQAWQQALPGKTVRGIDCQGIVSASGVMHCIAMHVPKARGGGRPTAYLRTPNGGGTLAPNSSVEVLWNLDDDEGAAACDLLLSADGGGSFPFVLARDLPPDGRFAWTVPDLDAPRARLRVVVRDAQGNSGRDDSDADFAIAGSGCRAQALAYGSGKAGSLGVPQLAASAPPRLGSSVDLQVSRALPSGAGVLLLGVAPASVPFDGGTVLVVPAQLVRFAADGGGSWSAPLAVPAMSGLCGASVFVQAWIGGDAGARGLGFAASAGLELRLGV